MAMTSGEQARDDVPAPGYQFEAMPNPAASNYCRDIAAYLIGRQFISLRGRRPGIAPREIALHEAGHAVAFAVFGRRVESVRIVDTGSGYCLPSSAGKSEDDVSSAHLPGVVESLCVLAAGYLAHRRDASHAVELALMGAAHELGVLAYGCIYAQKHWGISSLAVLRATLETCDTFIDEGWAAVDRLSRRLEETGELHEAEIGECLAGMPKRDALAFWRDRATRPDSQPIGTGKHGELEMLLSVAIRLATAIEG